MRAGSVGAVAAVAVLLALALPAPATASPMWDYVHTPDPTYKWEDTGVTIQGTFPCAYTGHLINMTSQTWLTPGDVDHTVWSHQLMIIVPDNLNASYHTAEMYITGGCNDNPSVPSNSSEDVLMSAMLSCATGTVGATLFQEPNCPIVFSADPEKKPRGEDALVGWTWYSFIKWHQDEPEWVVFYPMVKAAVRAMDTITAFAKKTLNHDVSDFVVAGASKRGWTTWLTQAMDTRVVGGIPIVMDLLNFIPNLMHMWQAYGGWTFAFEPYWELNITKDLTNASAIGPLAKQVDPLNYKENLTMPTLVVDSTGDEFFMPDDDAFWWDQRPDNTYRLMVANAEHSFATGLGPLIEGAIAFTWSILNKTPRPVYTWDIDNATGTVTVHSTTKPNSAYMKFATTFAEDDGRRDFRLIKGDTQHDPCDFIKVNVFGTACINPVLWGWMELQEKVEEDGTYTYTAFLPQPPEHRWRAWFIDLQYPGDNLSTFRMTTQVSIQPNTFPFPACEGEGCYGWLV